LCYNDSPLRALPQDDGFMMVPDTKWDLKDPLMLYTIAIAKDPSIRSLRDLRGRHVPMLQRLRSGALATLHSKHGLAFALDIARPEDWAGARAQYCGADARPRSRLGFGSDALRQTDVDSLHGSRLVCG